MSRPGDASGRPLAGVTGPEVRRAPDLAQARARVLEAVADGWRVVRLDTDDADGADGFLEACAVAFELPAWFGANWDALDESLADYRLAGESGLLVVWTGWQELAEGEPRAMSVALDVLRTAVTGWRSRGVAAELVLAGPGSDPRPGD